MRLTLGRVAIVMNCDDLLAELDPEFLRRPKFDHRLTLKRRRSALERLACDV